jgi:hypothetical protein
MADRFSLDRQSGLSYSPIPKKEVLIPSSAMQNVFILNKETLAIFEKKPVDQLNGLLLCRFRARSRCP